jgi:hypothetical protein
MPIIRSNITAQAAVGITITYDERPKRVEFIEIKDKIHSHLVGYIYTN